MKLLILSLMLGVSLIADSLILDIGAKSNHLIKGSFNEQHEWKGIGYRFIGEDSYNVQGKYVEFTNSYSDDTKFIAVTGIYTPINYKGLKLGVSGSLGYQRGYYVSKQGTHYPSDAKRLGISNKSILVLYSLYGEYSNIIVNYTYIPNSVQACTLGIKIPFGGL